MGSSIYHVVRFSEILNPRPPSWSNMVIWPTPSRNHVVNPGSPQHHPQKFHKYLYTFYNMLVQLHSYPKICHVTAQIENSRNHFLIWRKIHFSPSDHVVILRTLPSPLVVIHGHFVNPPSPLADHVVYGWPLLNIYFTSNFI